MQKRKTSMCGRVSEPCHITTTNCRFIKLSAIYSELFRADFSTDFEGLVLGQTEKKQEMLFLQTQVIIGFMPFCRSNDIISVGGRYSCTPLCSL